MLGTPSFAGFPFSTDDDASPVPSAGLAMWLDAARGLTLDGATSRVSAWASRVGSASATQATTAAMPTVGSMNGLPSVLFDGADDWMAISSLGTLGSALTLVYVARTGADDAYRVVLDGAAGALNVYLDPSRKLIVANDGVGTIGETGAGTVPADGPALVAVSFDRNGGSGGPWQIRLNRAVVALGTVSASAFSAPTTMLSRASNPLTGQLCEMLLYTRVLSSGEQARTENYLASKWGIV